MTIRDGSSHKNIHRSNVFPVIGFIGIIVRVNNGPFQ